MKQFAFPAAAIAAVIGAAVLAAPADTIRMRQGNYKRIAGSEGAELLSCSLIPFIAAAICL